MEEKFIQSMQDCQLCKTIIYYDLEIIFYQKGYQFHLFFTILKREKLKNYFGVMSQIEIKPSLESYKLADTVVNEELSGEESNLSLKDAWINLGTNYK